MCVFVFYPSCSWGCLRLTDVLGVRLPQGCVIPSWISPSTHPPLSVSSLPLRVFHYLVLIFFFTLLTCSLLLLPPYDCTSLTLYFLSLFYFILNCFLIPLSVFDSLLSFLPVFPLPVLFENGRPFNTDIVQYCCNEDLLLSLLL